MMIFVAVGTQKFQMNRLLKVIDTCIEEKGIEEEVFAQIGNSTYIPQNYNYSRFLNKVDFENKIKSCDILITHSGVATIFAGIKWKKPIIVVPRLSKYNEHVDDHQLEIADSFQRLNYVLKYEDELELSKLIYEARRHTFDEYVSQREKILNEIETFIDDLGE